MDLVGACRAFVNVSARESFTAGATAAGMSQPVASRRIAALEQRLGQPLLERGTRRLALTPFGRDLLPAARRLLQAADALEHESRSAGRKPWRLAVPLTLSAAALARLIADARQLGLVVEPQPAAPADRTELLHTQQARAALMPAPADEAAWTVPLGLAGLQPPGTQRVHLDSLRPGRHGSEPPRHIWFQPEDDVPHIRDPLMRLRDAAGLRLDQLRAAPDLATAAAHALGSADLVLCSQVEARELDLTWLPPGELSAIRGYVIATADQSNPKPLQERLHDAVSRCLGAFPAPDPNTPRSVS
ncbi:LysR family transcriptional regulator [Streptomyces sp. O3]